MKIIDPYRKENERALRWLRSLSQAEKVALLKEAGILDKRGNLAVRYRTPKPAKAAKPSSPKAARRGRAAS